MKRPHSSSKTAGPTAPELALETDADRARAIVAALRTGEPSSDEMFEAFWQLDLLPVNDVREAFTSWLGPLPDIDRLDPVTRRAHGFPPPALSLRTLSVARDADVLDLGPIAEEQLRVAGATWDGADLAPEDRLDGELEGSLAGTLERRVLADVSAPEATPLFDVMLFAEDSGVVFASGTTNVVALIAYRKVETRDRRVRTALQDVLSGPEIAAPNETVVITRDETIAVEVPPAKTVAATSVTPKTIRAKEPATKKAATTKTVTKKTGSKKTASVTKKSGPKKSAAKKSGVKKPAAKKSAAATKTSAKKSAAKKSGAKKVVRAKTVVAAKKIAAKKSGAKKPEAKKQASKTHAAKKQAGKKKAT